MIQSSLLSNCCSVWRIQLTVLENNTLVVGTRDDAMEGLVRTPVQFNVRTNVYGRHQYFQNYKDNCCVYIISLIWRKSLWRIMIFKLKYQAFCCERLQKQTNIKPQPGYKIWGSLLLFRFRVEDIKEDWTSIRIFISFRVLRTSLIRCVLVITNDKLRHKKCYQHYWSMEVILYRESSRY